MIKQQLDVFQLRTVRQVHVVFEHIKKCSILRICEMIDVPVIIDSFSCDECEHTVNFEDRTSFQSTIHENNLVYQVGEQLIIDI